MTKKLIAKVALLFVVTPVAFAQNASRTVESFANKGNVLEITTNDGKYVLKPYSDKVIETAFVPKGQTYKQESHAVVISPAKVKTSFKDTGATFEYATPGLAVSVTKVPFQISYSYKGKPLVSEKTGYSKKDGAEVLDFNLDSSEALYGAGARALGMNRRGNRLPLYNRAHYGYEDHSTQMNFGIPLVFSSKQYGIHFDNAPIGFLDLDSKKDNVLAYETISGRKTYQVIAGDSWEDIVANYTQLTGRQPLPPRWAFGNFASRFGYHTEAEARATIKKFRDEQIPVDAIIFDLYWFGKDIKGTMGNLEFLKENFPTPQAMISDLNKDGVKTILITEPFILTSSGKWNEAVEKKILATDKNGQPFKFDFYFGNTGLVDIFNQPSRDWFWNIYKNLAKEGVAGWWGDLGEPEVHPSDLQHKTGSADEVHNIYGHNWAKLLADGYKKDFPEQRPFILMRSGYSGSQRFGLIPWSGDVNRSWGGLQSQPEISLQMGLQGLGYMHSDLGGFAGANLDDELYARWLQYGVFQPIFRPHAQEEVPAEPVFRADKPKALAKAAIELRYKLLPYNYTLAFENNQQGLPLMRPLFYDEPQNAALYSVANTYFWGHEFLVNPILKAGVTEAEIYFPAKNNWFDFYSDQKYTAGTKQKVAVVADHIPVFVRAGAFIPQVKVVQTTRDYSTKEIELHYYQDEAVAQSSGKLYDDNGATPNAFEKGAYELLKFNSTYNQKTLRFALSSQKGKAFPAIDRSVTLVVHNINTKPQQVLLKNKAVAFKFDEAKHVLTVVTPWAKNTAPQVTVQFAN